MNEIEELVKEITPVKEERPKTYTAEVSHTDEEGVVWVRLPGAEQDTPTASTSTDVKMGDTVTVEWRNNKLYIAGNYTNPSAGVARVSKVEQTAEKAMSDAGTAQAAADSAQETANAAITIAGGTDQHFWFTETGTDTGAHITEATQEDFLADPTNGGGNLLARSNGIAVRDGLTELSTFAASGARVGQTGQSHVVIDYHSMQLKDKEGNTYFHVSDLRDETGNAEITEYIYSDGGTNIISVKLSPITSVVALKINSADKLANVQSFSGNKIYLDYTMSSGAFRITVTYTTTYPVKAYTLGTRSTAPTETLIGPFSVCEGSGNFASNYYSHAEGSSTNSTGVASHAEGNIATADGDASHAEGFATNAREDYSHAEGYVTHAYGEASHAEGSGAEASGYASHAQNNGTTAGYDSQTAIGRYNDNQANSAFEIGNGTSDTARSNAFEVDWDGNTTVGGELTVGGHSSPIGTIITGTRESTAGTATTSYTTAAHVDLTAGTWHIAAHNSFNGGTAGMRRVLITNNPNATTDAAFGSGSGYAPESKQIVVRAEYNTTITTNTTFYLRIYSNSQVSSPIGNLTAVRIA